LARIVTSGGGGIETLAGFDAGSGSGLGSPLVDGDVGAVYRLVDPHARNHPGEVRTRVEGQVHAEVLQRWLQVQVGREIPARKCEVDPAKSQPSRDVGEHVGGEQLRWHRMAGWHQDPHGEIAFGVGKLHGLPTLAGRET
jgi:hypothetical protein